MKAVVMDSARKDDRLSFRVTPEKKSRLRQAADASDQELTQFVLSAALVRADQVLADRTRFVLGHSQWERFREALDAPVVPKANLRRLLIEPSLLEDTE